MHISPLSPVVAVRCRLLHRCRACPCRRDGRVDPGRPRPGIGLVLSRMVAGPRPGRHPQRADSLRRRERQAGHRHRRRRRPAGVPGDRHHHVAQRNRVARRSIPTRRHGSACRVAEGLGRKRTGRRPRRRNPPWACRAADFTKVRKDLAATVDFSTVGMTRRKAVEKIAAQLELPLRLDADIARELADDKVEDQLKGLSCGTALACVLRPAGYSMAPRAAAGQIVYTVVKAEGHAGRLEHRRGEPRHVQNVADRLDHRQIGPRRRSRPVRIAQRQRAERLGRHGAGGDRQTARRCRSFSTARRWPSTRSIPPRCWCRFRNRHTTYSLALRAMLFRAKLKFEVRYDDAGSPFLWITTNKPAD